MKKKRKQIKDWSFICDWYENEKFNTPENRFWHVVLRLKASPLIAREWRYVDNPKNWGVYDMDIDVVNNVVEACYATCWDEIYKCTRCDGIEEEIKYGCNIYVPVFYETDQGRCAGYKSEFTWYNNASLGCLIRAIKISEMHTRWQGMMLKLLQKYYGD